MCTQAEICSCGRARNETGKLLCLASEPDCICTFDDDLCEGERGVARSCAGPLAYRRAPAVLRGGIAPDRINVQPA